jgi:uncharacterized phage protein (TIGR01671 family)
MREIKFRYWDKESMTMPRKISNPVTVPDCEDGILMMWTGLLDKNGKEIYEGDIVLCGDNGEYFPQRYDEDTDKYVDVGKYEVAYMSDQDYPAFDLKKHFVEDMNALSYLMAMGYMKVIGNIYENPELKNV